MSGIIKGSSSSIFTNLFTSGVMLLFTLAGKGRPSVSCGHIL